MVEQAAGLRVGARYAIMRFALRSLYPPFAIGSRVFNSVAER